MATRNPISRSRAVEAAHGSEAVFQVSVIARDAMVELPRAPVLNVRKDGAERWRIAGGLVPDTSFWWNAGHLDRTCEERVRCPGVPALGKGGVHKLPILVDCAVAVRPRPVSSTVRRIDAPCAADEVPVWPGGILEQGQETLHPAIDRAASHDQATLGKPRHHIGRTQAVADIPTDSEGTDGVREAMA
jgi:hypothetical protein